MLLFGRLYVPFSLVTWALTGVGPEWFETSLLDYDPCSNHGNWNYVAGDYTFIFLFNSMRRIMILKASMWPISFHNYDRFPKINETSSELDLTFWTRLDPPVNMSIWVDA
ncbi:hypothetical protein DVH24_020996 [Malus domestica]|uniref:Uncharacterized protein n=1 Tax=Malus domestica TaxID=3750 RepID=A0A498JDS7_MALDO|nr:hypothetical protein DVH24_020996 [Malus domestica]